jgi:non-heme chloroperoxidase
MKVALHDSHHLHVRVHGDGAPDVLLLHGWVVSGEVWQPVIDRWPAHGAGRLLVPDLRGTGWSSKPSSGYRPEDHAADVSSLIDALSLGRVVLVGHSMGGLVAQRVAIDRPEAVARLTLVCPVPASGAPMNDEQVAYLHALGGHHDGVRQVITMLFAQEPERAVVERVVLAASATSEGAYHEALDAWRKASFADRLSSVAAPTLVVGCASDAVQPPSILRREVVARIPGARYVELANCGHYPQMEAPDALTRALLEEAAAAT